MANEIKIDLSLSGEHATARGLKNVGDAADKAGNDLGGMAKDAGFLDKRVGELRGELKGLFAEFNKTGNVDILKKIKVDQRELGQLDRLKKQMASLFDGDDKSAIGKLGKGLAGAGATAGARFGEELTASLRAFKGPAIAALVAIGAAATPFLSGVISSAVIGGVGLGGIIGGIALAAQDTRIQDAGADLGKHAMEAFSKSAEPFVGPVMRAMDVLDEAVDDIAGSMRQAFEAVAPALVPLTRGLTGLVKEMMPGLIDAMKGAKPVLIAIGAELPKIGHAIGQFFSTISKDPRGAITAFQFFSSLLQGTIILLGDFLGYMSAIWSKIAFIAQIASGDMTGAVITVANMNDEFFEMKIAGDAAAKGVGKVGDSAARAKRQVELLSDTIDRFFGVAMNSEDATIAAERAWDDMVEGLRQGKRTLDVTTEAGRKHREQIDAVTKARMAEHEARVQQGMDAQASLAIYDQEIEKIRARALATGYNKKELDALLQTARDMPELVSLQVESPGMELTLDQAKELLRVLRQLGGSFSLGAIGGAKVGGKRAAGGPVYAAQTYLVGENGPELVTMGADGNVVNAAQTAAMMTGASGGSAVPNVTLNVTAQSTGRPLDDALMEALAYRLRVTGGVIGDYRIPRR